MNKNIYLRKQEQNIFNAISSSEIVHIDEIRDFFPNLERYQINKICSSLSSKGYLYRLKRGIYLVQEKPSDAPAIKNPYKIALALFNGYISFSSALKIYGLLEYEPFTIFVATKHKGRKKSIGEYTFKSVAMDRRATGMTYYNSIYISTIAKTFFDCFYKPHYGGGYSTITKALYDAELDWGEFIKYFEAASSSLCQRTGYVLELMGKETDKIPKGVLSCFRKRIKNNAKLLPSGKARGRYIKEWKIVDNIGRENILSWCYHG